MAHYRYEHPLEAGVGEHHADPSHPMLADRPAQVMGAVPLGALDFLDLSADQKSKLAAVHELTMADLDMPHGTVVTVAMNDDPDDPNNGPIDHDGQTVVEWTDKYGTERRTAFDPAFFAEHFTEVQE